MTQDQITSFIQGFKRDCYRHHTPQQTMEQFALSLAKSLGLEGSQVDAFMRDCGYAGYGLKLRPTGNPLCDCCS